jgi:hypothetical protein
MRVLYHLDPFKLNKQFRATKSLSHIPTPAGFFIGIAVFIITLVYSTQRIDVLVHRKAANVQ